MIKLAYAGKSFRFILNGVPAGYQVEVFDDIHALDLHLEHQALNNLPDVLLVEDSSVEQWQGFARKIKGNVLLEGLILIVLTDKPIQSVRARAMQLKVNDVYSMPFRVEDMLHRINFLVKFKLFKPELKKLETSQNLNYKMRYGKRLFDIFCSLLAI
ncbi:MAG TPA: hypothetical protein VGD90_13755, partial [Sphingobacteriaceae bacterium]